MKVVCFGFLNTKYPESPLRLISRVDLENYKGLKIMSLSYIAFCQGVLGSLFNSFPGLECAARVRG